MRVSHGLCLLFSVIGTACGESAGTLDTSLDTDREATVEAASSVARPTVTVATYGDGSGSVATTPAAASCSGNCAVTVQHGARVTLTAIPEDGSEFLGWSGPDCSGETECTMTVTADQRVTAIFGRHRSLVVLETGSGDGTVVSSPRGISCGKDCSQVYRTGTVVVLTATPAAGSQFVGWRGGGCSGDGPCVVTLDAATLVKARFKRARCGNGILDPREQCDDGNQIGGDGCSPACLLEVCGNGILDPGEQCDDGNQVDHDGCSAQCQLAVCGNGLLDSGEQCDDGNQLGGDGCSAQCQLEICGNGLLDPGEQCDDGNQLGGDGCSPACLLEVCGNNILDPGEQCDTAGPSAVCNVDCTLPRCGDGLLNPFFTPPGAPGPEQCDDGNLVDNDGCSAQCQLAVCGNGFLDPGEQCDTIGQSATCDSDCTFALCGDGLVNPAAGEQCDDGPLNGSPGKLCSAACTIAR